MSLRRRTQLRYLTTQSAPESPQSLPLRRVDRLDKPDPAFETGTEVEVSTPVLALWPEPHTVSERGLEPIEVSPHYVNVLVHHQTGKVLAHSLAHDARLAMIHAKTFLVKNRGDIHRESLDTPGELLTTGECQIVA